MTMEKLNKDFLEFIQLLEKNQVKYLIVGGCGIVHRKHRSASVSVLSDYSVVQRASAIWTALRAAPFRS